jgi:uncharacterized protein YbjQ (UPF0145 family)
MIVTTDGVPGHRTVRTLGLVECNTVRTKHVGRDIGAGLKSLVGGEIQGYTDLMREARQHVVAAMVEQAREKGANAIIGVRFATSNVAGGASELLVYGTAAVVEPEQR